jgi:hypothetical protein
MFQQYVGQREVQRETVSTMGCLIGQKVVVTSSDQDSEYDPRYLELKAIGSHNGVVGLLEKVFKKVFIMPLFREVTQLHKLIEWRYQV